MLAGLLVWFLLVVVSFLLVLFSSRPFSQILDLSACHIRAPLSFGCLFGSFIH